MKKSGRGFRVTLAVLDGRDGAPQTALTFQGRTLSALQETLRSSLVGQLRPVLERSSPADEPSAGPAGRNPNALRPLLDNLPR